MNLSYRINKAWRSLTTEGPVVFSRKLARFVPWAVRRTHAKLNPYLPEALKARGARANAEYAFLSNPIFQVTSNDIALSKQVQASSKGDSITSATWFVPYFDHLAFGGIQTIFRFINGFAERGVHNRIVIYDNRFVNPVTMKAEIVASFPALVDADLVILTQGTDKVEDLPATDIGVCTIWMSAYFLLRFNQTHRKYYFIQDYEPLFYPGGSTFALAESTYRFGFNGIVNTPGLLRAVNQRHGLEGVSFTPAIDGRYYYPPTEPKANKRVKIFFYARPNNPRNAFELGILIIQNLIRRYGDRIEIITAGAEWNEGSYGLKGLITNLGLLHGLNQVGELYRSCDIGFVYMLSKHPSYQPFEFMASGMATVTNNNEDNLWFLRDGTNCLIAEPSAAAMAEKIGWLIDDEALRHKIQAGGAKSISTDWEKQVDLVWNDVRKSPR